MVLLPRDNRCLCVAGEGVRGGATGSMGNSMGRRGCCGARHQSCNDSLAGGRQPGTTRPGRERRQPQWKMSRKGFARLHQASPGFVRLHAWPRAEQHRGQSVMAIRRLDDQPMGYGDEALAGGGTGRPAVRPSVHPHARTECIRREPSKNAWDKVSVKCQAGIRPPHAMQCCVLRDGSLHGQILRRTSHSHTHMAKDCDCCRQPHAHPHSPAIGAEREYPTERAASLRWKPERRAAPATAASSPRATARGCQRPAPPPPRPLRRPLSASVGSTAWKAGPVLGGSSA